MKSMRILFFILTITFAATAHAQEITVDCRQVTGTLRPLHGINGGVLCSGETVDLAEFWAEAEFPSTRLHDCEWPAPAVVDIHAIFPDFRNDPVDAESYRFGPTDDFLAAIHQSGTGIIYRLGESIEHTKTKHFVNPPSDPEKWAEICLHVMRHYREGWADGFFYDIKYWEIWNEPENKPQMWTGTDEQYFELYDITAKKLKSAFPECRIGGPSIGGGFIPAENGGWKLSPYAEAFLNYVKTHGSPLDFYSWHTYTDTPAEYAEKAKTAREHLDRLGFTACEIHLNEWNYLPDNDWGPMLTKDGRKKEAWFYRVGSAEGAAFLAATLVVMQDAPVDVMNYYSGDASPFGLFTEHGVSKKTFYAMKAFRRFLDTPERLAVREENLPPQCVAAAGMNAEKNTVSVFLANFRNSPGEMTLSLTDFPWEGDFRYEVFLVDETHDLEKIAEENGTSAHETPRIHLHVPAYSVILIRFYQP